MQRQSEFQVHVIEDRFTAIRAAVSIAKENDVIVIAGRGSCDFVDWADVNSCKFRAWFDDRVEARNALATVKLLEKMKTIDRSKIPWVRNNDKSDE